MDTNIKKCNICNQEIKENAINLREIDGYDRTEYCNECYLHDIIPMETPDRD